MAGPIRQQINLDNLQRYVEENVPAIKTPLDVKQFGYGQSNPTYLLTDQNGDKYVMRKKPPGKLLSRTAHRVDREYKILHALEPTDVAVPKTMCFCDDVNVVGTPFYIMEFLDGRIFENPAMPNVEPAERRALWEDAVRTLARFHAVDPASVNMSSFGHPEGFYNRQIKLFKELCVRQGETKDVETGEAVGTIPHFEEMLKFFANPKTQPKDRGTFMHGDYKIDNVVFHKTEPKVIGILDWEMATIGHPLADLSNLLGPYATATNETAQKILGPHTENSSSGQRNDAFIPDTTPGLPTIEECLKLYAEAAGWSPTALEMAWAFAFNTFKGSVILQGIAARYAVRQASSERAKDVGSKKDPLGEVAYDMVKIAQGETDAGKAKL